jgi:hypothetical protein
MGHPIRGAGDPVRAQIEAVGISDWEGRWRQRAKEEGQRWHATGAKRGGWVGGAMRRQGHHRVADRQLSPTVVAAFYVRVVGLFRRGGDRPDIEVVGGGGWRPGLTVRYGGRAPLEPRTVGGARGDGVLEKEGETEWSQRRGGRARGGR